MNDPQILKQLKDIFPENWPEWVYDCLAKLENVDLTTADRLIEPAPEEIKKLFAKCAMKDVFKSAKRSVDESSGAAFLGAYVGDIERTITDPNADPHVYIAKLKKVDELRVMNASQLGSVKDLRSSLESLPSDHPDRAKILSLVENLNQRGMEPCELVEFYKQVTNDLEDKLAFMESVIQAFAIKQEAIKYTLKIVADQSSDERKAFHDAYSNALKKKPPVEAKYMNATDQMSAATAMFWPEVLKCKNATDLHDWFVHFYGKPGAFNQIAVSKFCERADIDLGAKQGRPKKQDD